MAVSAIDLRCVFGRSLVVFDRTTLSFSSVCGLESPYLQHRVATLLVQHGRRHQKHPTRNPFLKICRFRLCLVQAAVVNLFVLNVVCFIFVCLYTRNGQVGEHVLLWFLALVLAGCCCQFVCFEFAVLHFRLPIPETRDGQIIEHVTYREETKKDLAPPSRARGSTWGLLLQVC